MSSRPAGPTDAHRMHSWLLCGAAFLVTSSGLAQANYDGGLIGGRSSLMGGTGVAAGMDAAAPLQNPATTVDIQGTSFVFSTFFMQLSARTLVADAELVSEFEKGTGELSETQLNVLPNATCLFVDLHRDERGRVGAHKLSVCIAEPERSNFELASRVRGETFSETTAFQTRLVKQEFSKKVYAVGWAYGLSEQWSLGVTPMLQDVSLKDSEAVSTLVSSASDFDDVAGSSGDQFTSVMTKRANAFALSALVGVQYSPTPSWKAGLSVETPSFHLTGSYGATRSAETTSGALTEYVQESGSMRFDYPMRLALGIAGKIASVGFEASGYFHGGSGSFARADATSDSVVVDSGTFGEPSFADVTHRESVHPTVNLGVGADFPVARRLSVVAGILTDFSGLEARRSGIAVDDALFRSRVDAIHGSVGVAWTPPLGSILLGVRGMYGEGEMAVADPRTFPTERVAFEQRLWALSLVVSGQLSLGMLALVDPTGLVEAATKREEENSIDGSEASPAQD